MNYDVFNGDADGLCALHQLRLANPLKAELVTGVKRDIKLLDRVQARAGDRVTVLDISLDSNRSRLMQLLEAAVHVEYFDHHYAGEIPQHINLVSHIDVSADVCTSILVDRSLKGRYRLWAVAAAFGDNLGQSAYALAESAGLVESQMEQLARLGKYLNYNGYGDSLDDLHFHPAKLYEEMRPYPDPFDFIGGSAAFNLLAAGFREDMNKTGSLLPLSDGACHAAYLLPDAPWARRVAGVFANRVANDDPSRAHAVITPTRYGDYSVSVRAPIAKPEGADVLCMKFETGGGRKAAAGINRLPTEALDRFLAIFAEQFKGSSPIGSWQSPHRLVTSLAEDGIMTDTFKQSQQPFRAPSTGESIQSSLVNALLDPSRYSHAAKNVRLTETHISWVLLAGRYAYKIKKPVDLGFVNFTSLALRRYYCEEEIRLNRRLAPRIYLDVVPIGGTPEMPEFSALPALEYAVRMRRFASSKELDQLVSRGKILPRHMDSLAATIAHFHGGLPAAEAGSEFGSAAVIYSKTSKIFEQLQTLLKDGEVGLTALRHAGEAEYAKCLARFEQRRAGGFIRECHGDLHLGNIALIGEQPIPFDCIEFDPALRWIDVMSEVAFTVMDLLHCERPDLAYRFLNAYLEATGDYRGVSVLRYYIYYRAAVRAMVNAIRAGQASLSQRARVKALANCRSFLALAAEHLAKRCPALIITHGLPGSGKTTFAQAVLERLQAIRIRSDVERKRLFGLASLADSRSHTSDIYGTDATRRTYARLHELARELLADGAVVIVDAAFLKQNEREQFRQLARELGAPFAIASLQAGTATLRARITQRQSDSNDASEANLAVLESLQQKQETLSLQERLHAVEFFDEGDSSATELEAWKKLTRLLSTHGDKGISTI